MVPSAIHCMYGPETPAPDELCRRHPAKEPHSLDLRNELRFKAAIHVRQPLDQASVRRERSPPDVRDFLVREKDENLLTLASRHDMWE